MDNRSSIGRLLAFIILYAFGKHIDSKILGVAGLVVSPLLLLLNEALHSGAVLKMG